MMIEDMSTGSPFPPAMRYARTSQVSVEGIHYASAEERRTIGSAEPWNLFRTALL
jgi:hypothetical protein